MNLQYKRKHIESTIDSDNKVNAKKKRLIMINKKLIIYTKRHTPTPQYTYIYIYKYTNRFNGGEEETTTANHR